jgi:hypothetical protein
MAGNYAIKQVLEANPELIDMFEDKEVLTNNDSSILTTDETFKVESPYKIINGCLYRIIEKILKDNEKVQEKSYLANFVVIPKREIIKDDGQETKTYFELEGYLFNGTKLKRIKIPSEKFCSMNWVNSEWGLAPTISPLKNSIAFVRDSIQEQSINIKREHIYTHTGFRKINEKYVFLFNGGSIGSNNVEVNLEGRLLVYSFPSKIDNYFNGAKASLDVLDVAPPEITYPLLAVTYLSPLNEFLRAEGIEPAFITFLLGKSGTMKTTLSALFLGHYGDFSEKRLPMSFKDTPNSVERNGFLLKDVLTVLDDYHPTSKNDKSKMDSLAQAVARGYGDRVGRNRCNADATLKASYIPRGNIIITGEDSPNIGQSGTARYLTLEVEKGMVDKKLLTKLQQNKKLLNVSMRGYIEWLISQDANEEISSSFKNDFERLRDNAQKEDSHGRFAEVVAWLYLGFNTAINFFESVGVVESQRKSELLKNAWNIFNDLVEKQNKRLTEDKPAIKFLTALNEMLIAGNIFTVDIEKAKTEKGAYGEGFIGFEDADYYYLLPALTYSKISSFYQKQGDTFPLSLTMLLKHLEYENYIQVDGERRTLKKRIAKKQDRYIFLKKLALDEFTQE